MKINVKERIIELLDSFGGQYSKYDLFFDWVTLMALSITNVSDLNKESDLYKAREKQYLSIAHKHSGRNMQKFSEMAGCLEIALYEKIEDVLGEVYMKAGCGNKTTGQFFTPFHIQKMLATMQFPSMQEKLDTDGELVMSEPSCGGGGMIIAVASVLKENNINYQRCLKVTAQDLDWKAIYMTYVQLSYLGINAAVIQGDTLSGRQPRPEQVFETPVRKGLVL